MQRIVIDTNVYINWLNGDRYEKILFAPGVVKHLSSVVMMELWAGAFAPRIGSCSKPSPGVLLPSGACCFRRRLSTKMLERSSAVCKLCAATRHGERRRW